MIHSGCSYCCPCMPRRRYCDKCNQAIGHYTAIECYHAKFCENCAARNRMEYAELANSCMIDKEASND